MNLIIYLIVYPIIWCISVLPFPIFYAFSDFIYFLLYRVIGYRKKTVRQNIALALPHLSPKERLQIEKKFYQHLCDLFLEMTKTLTISEAELKKRFVFTNIELVKEMETKGKSIVLMLPHYASWEWMIILSVYVDFIGFGIYKKINNPYFDALVHKIRSRFKAQLIDTKSTIKQVIENENKEIKGIYAFLSDQTARPHKAHYWENFMGYTVPVHTGAEMLAKKLDLNVLYVTISKPQRGHYEATFRVLAEDVTQIPDYEISKLFLSEVEKTILAAPEFYLWTHKRWKHKK